jgi:3-phenylpropionate/trans-cinnamate dioxygenase ferredoxin subunit
MFNYRIPDRGPVEYVTVGKVGELGPGDRLLVDIGGDPVVILNIAGEYFAVADLCSHDSGPLGEGEVDDYSIECPRHGARFDVRTGEVLSLPAASDIPAYPVRIVGDELQVGIPIEASSGS